MKTTLTYTMDKDGIAEIIFDQPDAVVNLLTTAVMFELEQLLEKIKTQKRIKVLFFSSAKEGCFIAGADIKEIASLKTQREAYNKVRSGQQLLTRITLLPFPTVAIIDGACLGGGLELALCCDYRLATDSAKTKIGLPEVSLGVMPGFGGTQRLKTLVGLSKALELILGSKLLNGKKAEKLGLVDACVPHGYLDFKRQSFLKQIMDKKNKKAIVDRRFKATIFERFLPRVICKYVRKEVMKKTQGNYPAPLEVLELYENTHRKTENEALEMEAKAFAKLSISPISKNLISLFFTSEALKKEQGTDENVEVFQINNIGVFGGGVMGSGIVWLFSKANMLVRLKVRHYEAVGKTLKSVYGAYEAIIKRKRLTKREVEIKMGHITYTTAFDGLQNIDLCVEAITENSTIKKELYQTLESLLKPDAIIATNTSSLSIASLAASLKHPERFIGMHFFNPVPRMPLVEVIAATNTSARTVATVVALAKQTGKIPIVVGDCAGFLVNRVLMPYMNEAIRLFEEGADIAYVDALLKNFGMPMGPFLLADEVGLDIGFHVAEVLHDAYGERMMPSVMLERIAIKMKLLGKKGGEGFYTHKAKKATPNKAVKSLVLRQKEFDDKEIIDRVMLIMVNEASRALEEGIIKNAAYLDMAMVLGTGFPPFRGGLLRYADMLGIEDVVVTLKRLANAYGKRFEPSDLLQEMARKQQSFY